MIEYQKQNKKIDLYKEFSLINYVIILPLFGKEPATRINLNMKKTKEVYV